MLRLLARYACAIGIAVLASAVRYWLDPLLHDTAPNIMFFPAVLATAWFCGTGPAIACAATCAAATWWLWLPLLGSSGFATKYGVALALYAALSSAVIWMVYRVRRGEGFLRESEERFRLLVEGVTDYAIFMLDPAGHIVTWNAGAQHLKGYTAAEILGQSFTRLYTREEVSAGRPQRALEIASNQGTYTEEGWRVRKDGSRFWAVVTITAVRDKRGKLHGFSKIVRDMTERKQAEEALKKSVQRFRGTFENAAVGIAHIDAECRWLQVNHKLCEMLGYPEPELKGRPFTDMTHPDDHGEDLRQYEPLMRGEIQSYAVEKRYIHKNGQFIWVRVTRSVQRDDDGKALYSISIIEDINARKRSEDLLRTGEARLAGLVQSAMDAIISVDEQQRIVLFNAAAEKMFQSPVAEAMGQPLDRFIPERARKAHREHVRRFGETGETARHMGQLGTVSGIRANGEEFPIEASISHIQINGQKLFTVILRDITERVRNERALRDSEAQVRLQAAALESAPNAISLSKTDPDGTIVWVNSAFTKLTGYCAEEAIGRSHRILSSGEQEEQFYRHLWETIGRGEVWRGELVNRRKDGTLYHEEMGITPLRDADGKITHYIAVKQDITDRKRAEQALKDAADVQRLAAEGAGVGIWSRNLHTQQMMWTPVCKQIFGIPVEEAVTFERFLWTVHPDDREAVAGVVNQSIVASGPTEKEFRVVWPDGTLHWVHSSWHVVYDARGTAERALGIVIDITDKKSVEERLREEARRKDEFLAVLGHELRNPLGPIRNAVHLLNRMGPQEPAMQQTRAIIDRQVTQMARLLEDLLDVSRIKRGKVLLKKEPLNLAEVVHAAAEDHRMLLESNGLRLEINVPAHPIPVTADRARITQIVGNLLHNAAKFTSRGGRVWVQVCASHEQKKSLIAVRDTGMGMELDMLERVFQPFMQAERTLARSRGGLGLGLALVKGLAELHGGNVQAQSAGLGRGTEFIITLPMENGSIAARKPEEQKMVEPCSQRVLIVEDNLDAATSLQMLLELSGHQVEEAHDGAEGLEKARQFQPQVILCDIGLPGHLDGYAFAQAVRRDEALKGVHLIAMTGYGTEEDRLRAANAGFDLHMTKPVDPLCLERVIAEIASERGTPERAPDVKSIAE